MRLIKSMFKTLKADLGYMLDNQRMAIDNAKRGVYRR